MPYISENFKQFTKQKKAKDKILDDQRQNTHILCLTIHVY